MPVRKLSSIGIALVGLGLANTAQGAIVKFWDNPISGLFSNNSLWNPGSTPDSIDDAYFGKNGAYTVTFNTNQASHQFMVSNDKLVLDFGAKSYILTSDAADAPSIAMGMESGDVARLTIRNGNLNSISAVLGAVAGSSGSVAVTNDVVWNTSAVMTVGNRGTGNITVTRGGKINSNAARIGVVADSVGKVIVSALNSRWDVANNLLVGGKAASAATSSVAGSGMLDIRPGATVTVGQLLDVRAGGTLKLQGGTLTTGDLSSSGLVIFKAGNLNITQNDLSVGTDGPLGPTIHLIAGQNLRVDQVTNVASGSDLGVDGGTLTTSLVSNLGRFSLNSNGAQLTGDLFNYPGGAVTVSSPQATFVGNVSHYGTSFSVAAGSTAYFSGDVTGSSNFTGGGDLVFQGNYSPSAIRPSAVTASGIRVKAAPLLGSAPSPVSIAGSISFDPGTALNLVLGSDFYNQVNVTGLVDLADVNVNLVHGPIAIQPPQPGAISPPSGLIDGYSPQFGDVFTLVTGQTIKYNGAINVPTLPDGLSFNVIQGSQTLKLEVVPEPATATMLAIGGLATLLSRRPRRNKK